MNKIILGTCLILAFCSADAFAATENPALTSFIQQQNTDSRAFFAQQAAERAQWLKDNPQIAQDVDAHGKAVFLSKQDPKLSINIPAVPAAEEGTYEAFQQKQHADEMVFLQKQAQDKQNFLGSQP